MDYKNAQQVLEICNAAVSGPWHATVEGQIEYDTPIGRNMIADFVPGDANAQFIAISREALPYWLERCRQLEMDLKTEKHCGCPEELKSAYDLANDMATKAEADNARLHAELEQAEAEINDAKKAINDCEYTYDPLTDEVPLDVSIRAILSTINEGAQEIIELAAQAAAMRSIIKDLADLIGESTGVIGYHLSGDIAEWDTLFEFEAIDKALSSDAGKDLLEEVRRLRKLQKAGDA